MAWPTFPIQGSRLVSAFRGDFNDIIEAMLGAFTGATEPTPKYAGQFWVDTSVTPRLLKQRNTANTAWIIRARIDTDYGGALPIAGGTMEGAINMGGYSISNLPLGAGNSPARYADLAGYAKLDGSIPFTGIPSLPTSDPTLADQAARKDYVDRKAVGGGTFTGQIALPVAATDATHALRKGEFDSILGAHAHTGAAGMGPKIGTTGLSPSATNGYGLRTRAGAVEWQPVAQMNDSGILIWNIINTGVGWTLIDLTSYTTHARVAILLVEMRNTSAMGTAGYFTLGLRSQGAANSLSYFDDGPPVVSIATVRTYRWMLMVGLNNLRFEYTLTGGGNNCHSTGYLIGWI